MDRNANNANQGWRCPDCGKINASNSGFCTGCGRRKPQVEDAAQGAFAGWESVNDQGGYGNNAYQDPRNTGYQNTGYQDPRNTGYYQDPRNTGYQDPRNTGYVDPRNTGYYDPADTGYYDPVDGGGRGNNNGSGGVLKILAIVLVCLLVAVAVGFGISRILQGGTGDQDTGPGTETEQGDDGWDDTGDTGTDPGYDEYGDDTDPSVIPDDESEDEADNEDPYFKVGKAYKVVEHEGVRVRKGPSTDYEQVLRKDLSSEYYDQSLKGEKACLKEGATVYCISMEGDWMQISDGWVCVRSGGEDLIR